VAIRLTGELEGTRRLVYDTDGLSGSIEFRLPWDEVDPVYDPFARGLPRIGELWPGMWQPQLRCTKISLDDLGVQGGIAWCRLTAEFSTKNDLGDGTAPFFRIEVDGGVESAEAGSGGWVWESTNTTVTADLPLLSARSDIRVSGKIYEAIDEANYLSALGAVNDRRFLGRPAGTLRFESYRLAPMYDVDGTVTGFEVEFRFQHRSHDWRELWRPALQARGADGQPLYWQNQNPDDTVTYTTNPSKLGLPVYVNELIGQGSNPAGIGGWDKPKLGSNYLYEAIDLSTQLGIPPVPGDDAPGATP